MTSGFQQAAEPCLDGVLSLEDGVGVALLYELMVGGEAQSMPEALIQGGGRERGGGGGGAEARTSSFQQAAEPCLDGVLSLEDGVGVALPYELMVGGEAKRMPEASRLGSLACHTADLTHAGCQI